MPPDLRITTPTLGIPKNGTMDTGSTDPRKGPHTFPMPQPAVPPSEPTIPKAQIPPKQPAVDAWCTTQEPRGIMFGGMCVVAKQPKVAFGVTIPGSKVCPAGTTVNGDTCLKQPPNYTVVYTQPPVLPPAPTSPDPGGNGSQPVPYPNVNPTDPNGGLITTMPAIGIQSWWSRNKTLVLIGGGLASALGIVALIATSSRRRSSVPMP